MRLRRAVAAAASVAMVVVGLTGCGGSGSGSGSGPGLGSGSGIVIGSENFPENLTVSYIYADALTKAGITASVKPNLGARSIVEKALQGGQIQATIEYAGNLLSYYDPSVGNGDIGVTMKRLKPFAAKRKLVLGNASSAADSDAIAVTAKTAAKYHLTSLTQLKPYAKNWTFGGPVECQTRITCIPGLKKYYRVVFKSFKTTDEDGAITHAALQKDDVQAARIFSSDSVIKADHFVVLKDPKKFQGVGNLVPLVQKSKASAKVMRVMNQVSAALTTKDLVKLNYLTDIKHESSSQAAQSFVKTHHLG